MLTLQKHNGKITLKTHINIHLTYTLATSISVHKQIELHQLMDQDAIGNLPPLTINQYVGTSYI